jgi:hypothetical protein
LLKTETKGFMAVDGLQKGLFSKIIAKKRKLSGCGCVGKVLFELKAAAVSWSATGQ